MMAIRPALACALALVFNLAAPLCAADDPAGTKPAVAKDDTATRVNPFFAPSPLPFQYPQFDKIRDSDYAPAFEKGMADNRAEIEAIA
ncbi:MAG: dipeptidyl carboxypeptidase II, partial [Xanthomonadales bacterium]|nr:dipeptidyl carboxypeptidase II [Xanthomonadales bacterium]